MKIIAHKVSDIDSAKLALKSGVNYIEVDVSQSIFNSKFNTQHDAIKGKFGIGKDLVPLITNGFNQKIFLDLKLPHYSLNFYKKLSQLLKKHNNHTLRISGLDWSFVYNFCENHHFLPFFTLKSKKDIKKIKNFLKNFKKTVRLSVRHSLIDKSTVQFLKSLSHHPASKQSEQTGDYPKTELWAWTVNNIKEAKRLKKLGVDGIISDEWQQLV